MGRNVQITALTSSQAISTVSVTADFRKALGFSPDPSPEVGTTRSELLSQSLLHDLGLPSRGISSEGGTLRQTVRDVYISTSIRNQSKEGNSHKNSLYENICA